MEAAVIHENSIQVRSMTREARLYLNRHLAIYRRLLMTASCCLRSLISGQQSVNPSREAICMMTGKYERLTFVHLVDTNFDKKEP